MKTRGSDLIAEEEKLEIKSWNKEQSSAHQHESILGKGSIMGLFILLRKGTEQKAFWFRACCGADPHGHNYTKKGVQGHLGGSKQLHLDTGEMNAMKAPENQ